MRIGISSFAALVLLVPLAFAPARASDALRGMWSIEAAHDPGQVRLSLRTAPGSASRDTTSFEIGEATLGIADALQGTAPLSVRFTLTREAGTIACEGSAGASTGSGTFVFTPSDAFRAQLRERGDGTLDESQALAAASLDITLAFVDAIAAAGYGRLPIEQLIVFRALGIDGTYLRRVAAHGFSHLPADKLIELKALDVISARLAGGRA